MTKSIPLIDAAAAAEAVRAGAVLIDVRPEAARASSGGIAEALVVAKQDVATAFDPRSSEHLPIAGAFDREIVVFCSSERGSLAVAEKLVDLGYEDVKHIDGGYTAWRALGLEVRESAPASQ